MKEELTGQLIEYSACKGKFAKKNGRGGGPHVCGGARTDADGV